MEKFPADTDGGKTFSSEGWSVVNTIHRRYYIFFIGGKVKLHVFLAKILIFKRIYQKQHFCQMIKS